MTDVEQARGVCGVGSPAGDLKPLLEATDIGVLVLSETGTIRHLSATCERFLHLVDSNSDGSAGTGTGRPVEDIEARFDAKTLAEAIGRAVEAREPSQFRTEPTPDFPRTLLVSVSPDDVGGGDGGVSVTLVDVTEQRARDAHQQQLNEELGRLNRSLSEFTQIVSHDLRAPLRHIGALVTFLREDAGGPVPEAMENRLTQIEERIGAMGGLINDLLDYARSGTRRNETQSFDLQTLVVDTVDLVSDRAGIDVSIQSDIGLVTTNTVPLATCIRNLVDNAVKHHPGPDGQVVIRSRREGDDLMVTVADDGAGIDPVHHERIFQPMQSLGQGTGLGLSTITNILADHGGSIALESEPGRGSAFTLVWPLDVGQSNAQAE